MRWKWDSAMRLLRQIWHMYIKSIGKAGTVIKFAGSVLPPNTIGIQGGYVTRFFCVRQYMNKWVSIRVNVMRSQHQICRRNTVQGGNLKRHRVTRDVRQTCHINAILIKIGQFGSPCFAYTKFFQQIFAKYCKYNGIQSVYPRVRCTYSPNSSNWNSRVRTLRVLLELPSLTVV